MKVFKSFVVFLVLGVVKGQSDFPQAMLNAINTYRSFHLRTPNMVLDPDLNARAQHCAHYYATVVREIDNSCPYKQGAGENLHVTWAYIEPMTLAIVIATDFYRGIQQYDYNNPGYSPATGTFTQMIWADSTRLGVGYYQDPVQHKFYVVQLFREAGNLNTREAFQNNVMPRRAVSGRLQ